MRELEADGIFRKLIPVVGDGNCLFRAIALGCGHPQNEHGRFRKLAVAEMKTNPGRYSSFYSTIEQFQQRLETVINDRAWGDEVEALAIANALNLKILLRTPAMPPQLLGPPVANRIVELVFLCGNHYDLLIPADDPSVDSPCSGAPTTERNQLKDGSIELEIDDTLRETDTILQKLEEPSEEAEQDEDGETLTHLLQTVFLDRRQTVQWLTQRGVFPSEMTCPKCQSVMRRRDHLSDRPDGDFICTKPTCRCRRSIRENSFFRSLRSSPEVFCQIIIHWLGRDPRERTAEESRTSIPTITRSSYDFWG